MMCVSALILLAGMLAGIVTGSKIGGPSLSGRFLKARTYYSIRAATDHRASPEQFQARADELS